MKELDPLALPLEGRQLIEASAGTGKTYTITTLVLRLLLEKGLELDQILVVTYTRAATAELRARVRQRIAALHEALRPGHESDDETLTAMVEASRERGSVEEDRRRIQRALYATDEAAIFTIHGFCQRLLGDYAFETDTPFALELRAHAQALVAEVVRDYWTHATRRIAPDLYAALRKRGPQAIEGLVVQTAHGPLPRHVPPDEDKPRPDLEAWRRARDELRERWPAERAGLAQVLEAAKIRLTNARLAKTFAAIEEGLACDAPPLLDKSSQALFLVTFDAEAKVTEAGKGRSVAHPLQKPLRALYEADAEHREWLECQVRLRLWDAVVYARSELAKRTAERGEATFDQLLTRAHDALQGPRRRGLVDALQRRYRAALIDEFQDTDPLQYEIFTRAFEGLPLLLIGDPKQAIYSFRGADVFAYLHARESVGERVYTLSTNRRSDPGVLEALNHLYSSCAEPFALEQIRYVPVAAPAGASNGLEGAGAPVELLFVAPSSSHKATQEAEVCEHVASDIVALLESGAKLAGRSICAGDIAVLCRKNKQAHAVQQALSDRGVPSLLQGDSSVFDTPDALELERLLAALVDPGDARAVRSALAGLYLGLDARELDALSEDDAWERHRGLLLDAHRSWLERGFIQGLRHCLRAYRVDERLMARPDGARRWTNLQHLLELLQEASLQERLGPDGVLRLHQAMRTDVATRQELLGESAQIRLESLEDAVRLTTVHRSKGLEYPVVYCPFAWDGPPSRPDPFPLVHPANAPNAALLDLGSPDLKTHQERARLERRADDLRVLYVALTRAEHALRVVVGPLGGKQATGGALHDLLGLGAKQDAESMRARLHDLCEGGGGTLALRDLPAPSPRRLQRVESEGVEARARSLRRAVVDRERVTSFTALSHGETGPAAVDDGLDHDALQGQAEDAPTPAPESPPVPAAPLALEGFPRGAAAGTVVHELLERVDFGGSTESLIETATELLPSRGMPSQLAPALAAAMHQVLRTPLDGKALRLCDVPPHERVSELEFIFRVDPAQRPDGRKLARLLRSHGAPGGAPNYPDRLERLPLASLGGFLRGFIDLVFCHDGRFYVVDYKSNDLGPGALDYRPPQLAEAMTHHHYYLQYLLYGIAVHRYLRRRVPGYDYDSHFGGVYYLFLRGMAPERGAETGVFFDRPSAALMADLDSALGGQP